MNEKAYILRVWSQTCPEEETRPPRLADHELTLIPAKEVTPAEIPADVLLSVPGIRYVTELQLLPNPPTDLVRGSVMKFASRLAEELGGVVEIAEPDIAAGEKRLVQKADGYIFPPINQYTQMLRLSVWYAPDKGFDTLADGVLDVMEKYFPVALPVSYGSSADEETVYETSGGRAGFVDFLSREAAPVWFPHEPAAHVFVADAARRTVRTEGFRSGCLTVELPDKIYDIPEWKFALQRFLRELCASVGAFFGQIVRGESGVVSWWWRGIPIDLGVACVIGAPYFDMIPDCAAKGALTALPDGSTQAYFEEPEGPQIASELLSVKKKRFFERRSTMRLPDDFTLAAVNPVAVPAAERKADS